VDAFAARRKNTMIMMKNLWIRNMTRRTIMTNIKSDLPWEEDIH